MITATGVDTDGRADTAGRPGAGSWLRVVRWRPFAGHSLSSWLCLAGLVTTMVAGQTQYLGWPFAPNRILLALCLLALFHERTRRRAGPEQATEPPAWKQPRAWLQLEPVALCMAALLLWAGGSAIAAGTLGTSFGFFALLDRLALPFVFFFAGPWIFRTPQQRDLLLKVLVVIGLYLGATAFFEVIGPHSLIRPRFIDDPTLGIHYGRARGPFLSAEPDGLTMLTCAFAAWHGTVRLRPWWQPVALASAGLASLGCLLTLTRSIWLGFVVAVALAALRDPRIRRYFPVIGLLLVLGVLGVLSHYPGLADQVDSRAQTQSSLYDRASTDHAAVRMVSEHPVFGVGWVKFIDDNQDYVRQADDLPIGYTDIEAHNVFLGRAAELGLPGVTLFVLCILLGPVRALRRTRPDPARRILDRMIGAAEPGGWWMTAAATTCGWLTCLMLSPVPYPLPNLMVWMLAGMALADRRPAPHPPR